MKGRQQRLKAIELSLTPKQVVMVWLRNALQGTVEEGSRHSPPYRGMVANSVYHNVRNGMRGQPESLVERAALQARRQADSLYLLVVNTNMAVLDDWAQRDREHTLLLGYLGAELNGEITKDRVENLRLGFLMFIEPVILLDAAIAQVAAEHLDGQPMLFRDCEVKLQELLQMAEKLAKYFNVLADELENADINLDQIRNSLQSETDHQVSVWVSRARVDMLSLFGTPEEIHAAMDQVFLLLEPKSGEPNNAVLV